MLTRSVIRSSCVSMGRRFQSNSITLGSTSAFEALEANSSKKIFYFTASWCPPCKFIAPKFQKLSETFPQISFVKIDIDEYDGLASKYGVSAVPTFVLMNGKSKVSSFSGADENMLKQSLTTLNNA